MGVDVFSTAFLIEAGVSGSVLTIGRQALFGANSDYARLLDITVSDFEQIRAKSEGTCEGLLRHLGATSVDSLDVSGYEGASILHDLNMPVDPSLHQRFDLVLDGGSLEHVFNYPAALKSCMEMVKPLGKLLVITPSDNMCGHGFYQFSPELFYRAFSSENGFQVISAFLRVGLGDSESQLIDLVDPALDGKRREVQTSRQTLLYVEAQRIRVTELFRRWPQQSDFVATWESSA